MKVTIVPIVIGAFCTITKGLLKGLENLGVGGRGRDYPNDSIPENSQNPETNPGDLRRLALTQTPVKKETSANTDGKNSTGVNTNNTRYDWVGKVIHREMCKKFKFDHINKWYVHNPAPVLENSTHKLLWDFDSHTDHLISARRPNNNQQQKIELAKLSAMLEN